MNLNCPKCSMKFTQKANLKRHINVIHDLIKPFKCEYCDFTTGAKCNLKKHSCYVQKANPITEQLGETSMYSVEYNIQKRIETEVNGHRVSCPFGIIDIITDDTIIEIKKWDEHKKGIGQILGYSYYFPTYKKRLHFFGIKPSDKKRKSIEEVCQSFNIEITEE